MCWDDDWRPQFRVDAIPSYKAHRVAVEVPGTTGAEEVPDTLAPQVPIIVEVLAALGIARVGVPGLRGRRRHRHAGRARGGEGRTRPSVEVITGDRDLFQLVDDTVPVRVLYTIRGIRDLDGHRPGGAEGEVRRPVGAGVRGHGRAARRPERRAAGRAGDRGEDGRAAASTGTASLAGILAARDAGDPGLTATQKKRLVESADYLTVAPAVVRVAPDAPVGDVDDRLPHVVADADGLVALAERWGLSSSVKRVVDALALG